MKNIRRASFASVVLLTAAAMAQAEEKSNQPYIDRLKEGLPEAEKQEPLIQSVKEKLKKSDEEVPADVQSSSYIDLLKRDLPEVKDPYKESGKSFIETKKAELGNDKPDSAIAALNEGRSELKPKKEGKIRHAFGFRVGASVARTITGEAAARTFSEVYGDNWAPDLTLLYEFQPFHSEWFGNIGIAFSGGFTFHRGTGEFQFNLVNKRTGQAFGKTSGTQFKFISLPFTAGLNYRFNLFRILRPYVHVAFAGIGYMESRSDDKTGFRGISQGFLTSAGVNVFLNWFDAKSAWSLYELANIHHFYLTLDYTRINPLSGDVRFAVSGLGAGMTYEF